MKLRRSLAARAAVTMTAGALVLGSSVAGAWAQEESPTPETTSEEATSTDATADAEAAGHGAPNTPKDNAFALGQSMQIRVNADGEQNSAAINFRWSVSQLTIQGPPDGSMDGSYEVPVPEGGDLPRYLENFGFISVNDEGFGVWDVDVENGYGNQRSVSLFPQDGTPDVSLETKFTLDGEQVTAQDIVGKTGVVTATYKLTNNTTSPTEVTVEDLQGNPVTTTVDADTPLVAIAKTLLPYEYIGLNTGSGIQGADGRGNNQVQWIALPFRPLSDDGTASFGWSAHVTDGFIPDMLIQVAVLHIPAHEDDPATEEDESSNPGSDSPVNLDPAVAEIQAGLANVTAGIDQLFGGGGEDPLQALEDRLNTFFADFGTNLQEVAQNLQPTIDSLIAVNDALPGLRDSLGSLQEGLPDLIGLLESIQSIPNSVLAATLNAAGVPDSPPFGDGDGNWTAAEAGNLKAAAAAAIPLLQQGQGSLAVIVPLLDTLIPVAQGLENGLVGLQENLQLIAGGLPVAELPTLDQAIAGIVDSLLSSPGGQQLTAGLSQVQGGLGLAGAEISAAVAEASAAIAGGVDAANQAIVGLKAGFAGLAAKSAESPLIYGPLPEGTPEDTVLAGAYEFRIDAASTDKPYTLPRILVGVLALVGAVLIAKYLGGRSAAKAETAAA